MSINTIARDLGDDYTREEVEEKIAREFGSSRRRWDHWRRGSISAASGVQSWTSPAAAVNSPTIRIRLAAQHLSS